jgi:uridine phosphorylase
MSEEDLPLLNHDTGAPSAFTPESLMDSVRAMRGVPAGALPPVCVLEFDGDLTDWLSLEGRSEPVAHWACFHTSMRAVSLEGVRMGVIGRTIGGPYAVLVAEQLHAAGVRLIVGLTSAGRIDSALPLPCLVVAESAIRDEGTSFHYLPPSANVRNPTEINGILAVELARTGWPVRRGQVWTTDAPYRETAGEISRRAAEGALAVEMQAASLFAFAQARGANVAVIAMVSNAVDHQGGQFDTGTGEDGLHVLRAIARAAGTFLQHPAAPDGRGD